MFNEFLSTEEAKAYRQQRMEEAEIYRQHRQLGFSNYRIARWVLILIILFAAVVVIYL